MARILIALCLLLGGCCTCPPPAPTVTHVVPLKPAPHPNPETLRKVA